VLYGLSEIAVGAGNDNDIAIGVAKPNLAVIGVRIHLRTFKNLCSTGLNSEEGFIEAISLEPKQDPVPIRLRLGTAQMRMVMRIPMVKLHNQPTIEYELLVFETAVVALTVEHSLIPLAARFDIPDCDKGLWIHDLSVI
jgi:hypothetical protein